MKVIVGSHDLWPTPEIASAVLVLMLSDTEQVWAVRARRNGDLASGVEELAMRIGERIGRTVVKHYTGDGSSGAFQRDNHMVTRADEVFAFFAPEQFMHGGTGHVVAAALRLGKAVTAYRINDLGQVVEEAAEEGDFQPMEAWQ